MTHSRRSTPLVTQGTAVHLGSFLATVHAHDIENVLSLEFRRDLLSSRYEHSKHLNASEAGVRMTFAWDSELRAATHRATTLFIDNDELRFERRDAQSMTYTAAPLYLDKIPWVFELKDDRLIHPLYFTGVNLVPDQLAFQNPPHTFDSVLEVSEEIELRGPLTEDETVLDFDSILARSREENAIFAKQEYERMHSLNRDIFDYYPWLGTASPYSNVFGFQLERDTLLHIGPVRHLPDRFETLSPSDMRKYVGRQGEHTVQMLANDPDMLSTVNQWLERLHIHYILDVVSVESEYIGDTIAMSLRRRDSHIKHSFSDVGYGISQVVPIVAQCFSVNHVTLCIEQPELHIHPRLQAELGDLFIAAAADLFEMDDDDKLDFEDADYRTWPGNQLIVETHSEHLLLRLQRRIREGVISNEDVSVLYVDTTADGTSTIQTLRLDTDGSFLDEWPGGFFEERFNEIFGA